jgi:crossover junction endonuclease MUS81
MIRIIIDSRETCLYNLVASRDLDKYKQSISIDQQQLEIGDIHITYDDKRTWIFERKTVPDMIASIKDGRYKEQKMRLQTCGHDVTYIIEGDDILSNKYDRYHSTLAGSYLHTMYRDNIRIIFTKSLNDTCTLVLTMATKIIDRPDAFTRELTTITPDYIDCIKIKTKKIDNITPENCYLMQLAQIPTISAVIAKNIQTMYPTMRDLVYALEATEDKIGLLCKIEKVGKEKASKILEFMQLS